MKETYPTGPVVVRLTFCCSLLLLQQNEFFLFLLTASVTDKQVVGKTTLKHLSCFNTITPNVHSVSECI